MSWLSQNWYVIVSAVACIAVIVAGVIKFVKEPRETQIKNLKEWLKYAVTEAEKALGSGTGQLKLRYVYDMATSKFAFLKFITFDKFSEWVDEALEWLENQLESNTAIQKHVDGEE